jgi:hypothetical protein
MDNEKDIVKWLRVLASGMVPVSESNAMGRAADEIERLRAERDRARRTLCQVLVLTRPPGSNQGERGFAKEMGWDCFSQEDGK